jgi:hypothetical protein
VAMLAFKFGMLANAKGEDKCNAYEGKWEIRKNYIVNWWCWWIKNCCNRDDNRYPMIHYLTSMTRSSPSQKAITNPCHPLKGWPPSCQIYWIPNKSQNPMHLF